MNLLLVKQDDITEENGARYIEITDKRRTSHIKYVLKATVGKQLKCGIVGSTLDVATVTKVDNKSIRLQLSDRFREHCEPPVPVVDLVVGIPRPRSLDKLLQYCASMGVGRILLVCSSRVELDYLKSHQLEATCIEESLMLGMEQGVTTYMPRVEIYKSLGAFQRALEKEPDSLRLIAHPCTNDTLGSLGITQHQSGAILVAIGPEGGWLEHEVDFYAGLGFKKFNIGERILRAEVAAAAVVSQLQLLLTDVTLRNGNKPAVRV
ncbi:16S ribosomal protein RNA methyltransferase [Babesia ovis]|uniref:16S rRNA (uracil(1498)-N(3))-methyltransferase n=1 Tax=Babesia ovis TaxID=5869 RepID=A0A9W5TA17_BABOV|nr:16S ribosomal protein RNA methyltransferase [Babesia ovis]